LQPQTFRSRPFAALALLAAALLAGCGDGELKFAPACPQISLLADGADLTRFNGPGRDVVDRVLEARLTAVDGACRAGRNNAVVTTLKVQAELRRGPAAQGRRLQIPYFVAVLDGERILDRQDFVLEANFPGNVDGMRVTGDELELRFPSTADRGAARYRVVVSLQLSQEELAFNRRAGAR
jgi:hypothetical protein